MRFFRGIIALMVALALGIAAAYVISIITMAGSCEGLTLPTYAPSGIVLEAIIIIYFLLAITAMTVTICKREIIYSIATWVVVLCLNILAAVAFFRIDYKLLSLAALMLASFALLALMGYYIKYTRELYLTVVPMLSISVYLTLVNFAIIMLN